MKKKFLSILLTLCLVMALVPMTVLAEETQESNAWDGSIATAFAAGAGTAEDPYQIATGAQLAYLASSVNAGSTYEENYFILTEDIDLNGLSWTPIANSFADALFGGSDYCIFAGNFDGKGHTISNLAIGTETAPLESDVLGLFGATEGKITNLNLDNVSINGVAKKVSNYVIGLAGAIAGSAGGSIENCHVTGLSMNMNTPESGYVAAYWIGGLTGALDGEQYIDGCSVSGSITEKSGKGSIGGLIGELGEAAQISYSRAEVDLNVASSRGGADVGGFIGKGNGNKNEATIIRNCYATGNVTGGSYAGGFAGSLWGLNMKNCYATGDVKSVDASMATFVGTDAAAGYAYGSIKNCYTTGAVVGTAPYVYAFAVQDATKRSEITNCYFVDSNSTIKNQNESAIAKSLDEMKAEEFASVLNADDSSNGWFFVKEQTPLCGAEPADYSAVDAALATIPEDLTIYTDESVAVLNEAKANVIKGKTIVKQSEVNAMAEAVTAAVNALVYKPADYTKVDEAIAKANALNKDDYKDFTAVDNAIKAVSRDKNITEQAEVDAMAKAIEDAIAALEKKPVDVKPADTKPDTKTDNGTNAKPKTTGKNPQTGDTSNLALWLAFLFVSGGAVVGTTAFNRKKKYNR